MIIEVAHSDAQIAACFDILQQLRPALQKDTFVADVRRMAQQGYQLAYLADPDVRAVAGFRLMEMFATGPILYIDDLITDTRLRSQGYGEQLLTWLREYAQSMDCRYLELDSGLERLDAHRFYRRMGMEDVALHFSMTVDCPSHRINAYQNMSSI